MDEKQYLAALAAKDTKIADLVADLASAGEKITALVEEGKAKDEVIDSLTDDLKKANLIPSSTDLQAIEIEGKAYIFKAKTVEHEGKKLSFKDIIGNKELASELLELAGDSLFTPLKQA